MFTWTEDATEAQKKALADELPRMPKLIGTIREYKFGPDAGVNPRNCDFAVVADFDDAGGYLVYRDHPDHRALVRDYVEPIVATRSAVQYRI